MKITKAVSVALKGFGMGAANVVPGVSGGTIALLTGIYSEIVDALNAFTCKETWQALFKGRLKDFWKLINGNFLVALGAGVLLSIFTLAKLMTYVLENHPVLTWAFFFGLILASVFFMVKDVHGWGLKDIAVLVTGILLGVYVCTMSPSVTPDGSWFIFICGAIAVCTMILPGISGSFILVVLGKYDYIMQAIGDLNWPVLAVFAAGCIIGILAFAKFLHWLLARWECPTMLVLTGFVLGSLIKVWPWNQTGHVVTSEIPGALLWCLIGAAIVVALELLSKKTKKI